MEGEGVIAKPHNGYNSVISLYVCVPRPLMITTFLYFYISMESQVLHVLFKWCLVIYFTYLNITTLQSLQLLLAEIIVFNVSNSMRTLTT